MWISARNLFLGLAFSLPFLIANALVALQEEYFLSLLRPRGVMTSYEQIIILSLIALVGVGGLVALLPLFKDRRIYVANAIVGALLIAFTVTLGYELGKDFYRCDILNIPNCD